jgi:ribonuclease BN (tRNA processing enzyme)
VEFCSVTPGRPFQAGGVTVEAVRVNHCSIALAYLVEAGGNTVLFSGDTGPVDALWEKVKTVASLKAVFLECSFPAAQQGMAAMTKHLSTSDIVPELQKAGLDQSIPVYLYHLKPGYREAIEAETAALKPYNCKVLATGDVIGIE